MGIKLLTFRTSVDSIFGSESDKFSSQVRMDQVNFSRLGQACAVVSSKKYKILTVDINI